MNKKLVWINEDVAKRLQFLGATENLSETEIKRIIDDLRQEIALMDAVSFRLHVQRVRDFYKQVVDEEVRATQELWKSLDAVRYATQKRIEQSRALAQSVADDIMVIKKSLDSINVYGLDKVLDMIHKVGLMSEQERAMLAQLLSFDPRKVVNQ